MSEFERIIIKKGIDLYLNDQVRRLHLNRRLQGLLVGLEFTPIGRVSLPRKVPRSPLSTRPGECSGFYHLKVADLMQYAERVDPELYEYLAGWLRRQEIVLVNHECCQKV